MRKRIIFSVLLLISVVFAPLWLTALLAFGGMVYFPIYAEGAGVFLISDLLFSAPESKFHGMILVSFLSAIFMLGIVEFLKKKLKFYPDKSA